MFYKDEDGKYKQLKPRDKMPTVNDKTREYWKKRCITWHKPLAFARSDRQSVTGTPAAHLAYAISAPLSPAAYCGVMFTCALEIEIDDRNITLMYED